MAVARREVIALDVPNATFATFRAQREIHLVVNDVHFAAEPVGPSPRVLMKDVPLQELLKVDRRQRPGSQRLTK